MGSKSEITHNLSILPEGMRDAQSLVSYLAAASSVQRAELVGAVVERIAVDPTYAELRSRVGDYTASACVGGLVPLEQVIQSAHDTFQDAQVVAAMGRVGGLVFGVNNGFNILQANQSEQFGVNNG